MNLILPESRAIWPTSSSLIVWIYLHSHFRGGLRKTHVFWNRVRNGPSRSSKVIDFGTDRKRVCDFLLVSIEINWFYLAPFQIYSRFSAENSDLIHIPPNFGVIADVVAPRCENPKLIIRVINFEMAQHICPQYLNVADGRTSGRTYGQTKTYCRFWVRASRGKNGN